MKTLYIGIFLILSIPFYGQDLQCCKMEEEIKTQLLGTWKLKGSDNDSRFEFTDNNGDLYCYIYQYLDDEESPSIVHETRVQIVQNDSLYKLRWDKPLFHWNGSIEKMRSRQLIVEINGNSLKYKKED